MGSSTEVVSFRMSSDEIRMLKVRAAELEMRVSELARSLVRAGLQPGPGEPSVGISVGSASATTRTSAMPGTTTQASNVQIPDYPPELVQLT